MSGKSTDGRWLLSDARRRGRGRETLKGNGFRDTDVSVLVPQTVGPRQTLETSADRRTVKDASAPGIGAERLAGPPQS